MASSQRTSEATATAETSSQATGSAPSANTSTGQEGRNGGRRTSGSPATKEAVEGLRCDLLMNARYHASREAFLDSIHRILMFLIIVLGAAAITDLLGANFYWTKGVFAACAAVFAAIDLTADLSNRARCHALMKRRYFELLADLTSGQKNIVDVEAHMHRCSADEEPAFHALLAVCWNAAQEMVYGDLAHAYKIPPWHVALKNFFRFGRKYQIATA